MKERPILFSAPMVRAILEGRKTQTRRVVKPQSAVLTDDTARALGVRPPPHQNTPVIQCPYGQPGDRLWVRETHAIFNAYGQHRKDGQRWGPWGGLPTTVSPDGTQIAYYREGFDRSDPGRWRPSIHMPRWASRIDLEVTGVRVERLQDISEADAIAEGLDHVADGAAAFGIRGLATSWDNDPRVAYRRLWESINGPGSWDANPWVWAVEFRRVKP